MAEKKEDKRTALMVTNELANEIILDIQGKQSRGLVFPDGYNVENAVMSAMFIIKDTKDKNDNLVLSSCTPDSIKQSVWKMTSLGLDPNKKHCYFIPYGNKLNCQESYFGLQFRAKRADPNIDKINAQIVYEGDKVEVEINSDGDMLIVKHIRSIDNIDMTKIKGAYATIKYLNGDTKSEYMTMAQIRTSWSKSKTGGAVHKEFPDQMSKRTVLARLCTSVVNTTTKDTALYDTMRIKGIEENAEENEAVEELSMDSVYEAECEEVKEETKAEEPTAKKTEQLSLDGDIDLMA
jgi:recombination protein RecT